MIVSHFSNDYLSKLYPEVIYLWENFCKHHSDLYEKTCDEYICLLKSDLDQLEIVLEEKKIHISKISKFENRRSQIIREMNQKLSLDDQIKSVSDLLKLIDNYETANKKPRVLFKLNALLIDIIERIQEQNKQNQIFLNKALRSIKEIKDQFLGKKTYEVYTNRGMTQTMDNK